MDDLLTLKEIAKRLGVPESNLRYYRNRIGDFLPSVGKGRRRRYFPEAEEIFRKTIEYVNEGVNLDRIYAIFAENKPLALSEDIARPAQEELARLLITKIKEEEGLFPAAPQNGGGESNSAIVDALSGLQAQVREIKECLQAQPAAPGGDEEKVSALEAEAAELKQRVKELEAESRELREELSRKDTVIEGQKKALFDARDKRRELAEELERLKPSGQPPM